MVKDVQRKHRVVIERVRRRVPGWIKIPRFNFGQVCTLGCAPTDAHASRQAVASCPRRGPSHTHDNDFGTKRELPDRINSSRRFLLASITLNRGPEFILDIHVVRGKSRTRVP